MAALGRLSAGMTAAVGGARITGHIRWYHVGAVLAAGGTASALTVLLCCVPMLCIGLPASHALGLFGGDALFGPGLFQRFLTAPVLAAEPALPYMRSPFLAHTLLSPVFPDSPL